MKDLFNFKQRCRRYFRTLPSSMLAWFFGGSGVAIAACMSLALFSDDGSEEGMFYFLLGCLLVFLVAGTVLFLFRKKLAKKRGRQFSEALGLQMKEMTPTSGAFKQATRDLREQWEKALKTLAEEDVNLYEMPWYCILGEVGSGKTTLLQRSGLQFLLGSNPIPGGQGTRNCDFLFSREAVIIDTAGRFSFPQPGTTDEAEWEAFMTLLTRYRPLCPINGVIVTIPATSLLEDEPAEQARKGSIINKRLKQLQRTLGIQFPVYFLITKCDRILGFTEFFSKLPAMKQEQIVGWSHSGDFKKRVERGELIAHLEKLNKRFEAVMMNLLSDDVEIPDRDPIYVFPRECRTVLPLITDYHERIFEQEFREDPLFFRGVYFSSAVQEGKPIARACFNILQEDSQDSPALLKDVERAFVTSKPFFIGDLFKRKIFPEWVLIAPTRARQRFVRKLQNVMRMGVGAYASCLLILILTGSFMAFTRTHAVKDSLEEVENRFTRDGPVAYQALADVPDEIRAFRSEMEGWHWLLLNPFVHSTDGLKRFCDASFATAFRILDLRQSEILDEFNRNLTNMFSDCADSLSPFVEGGVFYDERRIHDLERALVDYLTLAGCSSAADVEEEQFVKAWIRLLDYCQLRESDPYAECADSMGKLFYERIMEEGDKANPFNDADRIRSLLGFWLKIGQSQRETNGGELAKAYLALDSKTRGEISMSPLQRGLICQALQKELQNNFNCFVEWLGGDGALDDMTLFAGWSDHYEEPLKKRYEALRNVLSSPDANESMGDGAVDSFMEDGRLKSFLLKTGLLDTLQTPDQVLKSIVKTLQCGDGSGCMTDPDRWDRIMNALAAVGKLAEMEELTDVEGGGDFVIEAARLMQDHVERIDRNRKSLIDRVNLIEPSERPEQDFAARLNQLGEKMEFLLKQRAFTQAMRMWKGKILDRVDRDEESREAIEACTKFIMSMSDFLCTLQQLLPGGEDRGEASLVEYTGLERSFVTRTQDLLFEAVDPYLDWCGKDADSLESLCTIGVEALDRSGNEDGMNRLKTSIETQFYKVFQGMGNKQSEWFELFEERYRPSHPDLVDLVHFVLKTNNEILFKRENGLLVKLKDSMEGLSKARADALIEVWLILGGSDSSSDDPMARNAKHIVKCSQSWKNSENRLLAVGLESFIDKARTLIEKALMKAFQEETDKLTEFRDCYPVGVILDRMFDDNTVTLNRKEMNAGEASRIWQAVNGIYEKYLTIQDLFSSNKRWHVLCDLHEFMDLVNQKKTIEITLTATTRNMPKWDIRLYGPKCFYEKGETQSQRPTGRILPGKEYRIDWRLLEDKKLLLYLEDGFRETIALGKQGTKVLQNEDDKDTHAFRGCWSLLDFLNFQYKKTLQPTDVIETLHIDSVSIKHDSDGKITKVVLSYKGKIDRNESELALTLDFKQPLPLYEAIVAEG